MVKIVTDSVASIPAEVARAKGIEVVSMFVHHKGREYVDAEMDVDEFYRGIHAMVDDIPTSSQPSQQVLEDVFGRAAQAGDAVLGVFMSSRMSGTFEGAVRVARSVKARHREFECKVIDSTSNSYDEAFSVFDAVDVRDAGGSLEECAHAVVKACASSRFLFTPATLAFLKAGGRIGGAAALLGNLIQLAPVLTVSEAEATTFAKVRTRKKALDRMLRAFREDVEAHGLKRVVVHYIGEAAPALTWAREAVEPYLGRAVEVLPVSPVIGCHVGPAVGLAYECNAPLAGKYAGNTADLVFSL
ncbi:DegV family protein [Adlercreutzia sp. ZJ242]|uniref:DegV family protein n=1 Tax=unclassified Adlercreutzia TaxID=2636013 RepID=UPI0013EABEDA|nr:DegV family protein [Adlercreutzia sp. ZJ242]